MPLSPDPRYMGRPECPGVVAPDPAGLAIKVNRLSWHAPFGIAANVSLIAAIGGNIPWTTADVTWDFGALEDDYRLPDKRQDAPPGATISANTGQFGPQVGFLYRTPGPKTITATLRFWTGSAFVTFAVSKLVTVESVLVRSTSPTGAYKLRAKVDAPAARSARLNWHGGSRAACVLWAAPGHGLLPDLANGFTVASRVRKDRINGTENLMGTWSEAAPAKKAWKLATVSGAPKFSVGTASIAAPATIADSRWHGIIAKVDPSNLGLRVDGGPLLAAPMGATTLLAPTDVPFVVGAVVGADGRPYQPSYNADVDELVVFGFATNDTEDAWIHNGGKGRHASEYAGTDCPIRLRNPLAAWSFDELEAGPRSDSSGNARTLHDHVTPLLGNANGGGVGASAGSVGSPGGEVTGWIAATARSRMLGDDTHPDGAIDPGDGSLGNPYQSIQAALWALPSIGAGNAEGRGYQEEPSHGGEIQFVGSLAGRPVLLVSDLTSGDFAGVTFCLSDCDGASSPTATVTAWDDSRYPTTYLDSTLATGANDGSAPEHAIRDADGAKAAITAAQGGGRRLRFKAGTVFDFGSSCPTIPTLAAPLLLDSHGTGPRPRLLGSGGNGALYGAATTGVGKSNEAIRGLTLDGLSLETSRIVAFRVIFYVPGSPEGAAVPPGINGAITLADCDFYANQALDGTVVDIALIRQFGDVGFFGGSITCGPPPTETDGFRNQKLIVNAGGWLQVTGTTIGGGGGGGQTLVGQGHHCYITCFGDWAFGSVTFQEPCLRPDGGAGDSKGYTHNHIGLAIKGAIDDGVYVPNVAIANCDVTGCQYGILFSRQNDRDSRYSIVDRIAVIGNRFHKEYPLGPDGVATGGSGVGRLAIRKNDFWGWDNTAISVSSIVDSDGSGSGDRVDLQASGNRIDVPAESTGAAIQMTNLRSVELINNSGLRHGSGNKSSVIAGEFAKLAALGTAVAIRGNQAESPDDPAHLDYRDLGIVAPTKYPLAAWQALGYDAGVTTDSLSWPDPAAGDFGASPVPPVDPDDPPPTTAPLVTAPRLAMVGSDLALILSRPGANWLASPPTFAISGGIGASIEVGPALNPTNIAAVVHPGNAGGWLTIAEDGSDGEPAVLEVRMLLAPPTFMSGPFVLFRDSEGKLVAAPVQES